LLYTLRAITTSSDLCSTLRAITASCGQCFCLRLDIGPDQSNQSNQIKSNQQNFARHGVISAFVPHEGM
jgi:hypothetical protein